MLAKHIVIRAEQAGSLPVLHDLLLEDSWRELLGSEFSKPYFKELERFVHAEWGKHMVFPPKDSIFRQAPESMDHECVWGARR